MKEFVTNGSFGSIAILVFFCSIGLSVAFGLFYGGLVRARRSRRVIFRIPLRTKQRRSEFGFNLLFMALFALTTAALARTGLVLFDGDGIVNFVVTFFGTFLGFDVLYFYAHRLMHTRRFAFMHNRHHLSKVCTPWTAFSLGPWEALVWMFGIYAVPVLASFVTPISIHGFVTYIVVLWGANVFGHLNNELMPVAFSVPALTQVGHPNTYHALHHARYVKNYSFFLTFLDRIHLTEWEDWSRAHRRVVGGEPFTKLTEKA